CAAKIGGGADWNDILNPVPLALPERSSSSPLTAGCCPPTRITEAFRPSFSILWQCREVSRVERQGREPDGDLHPQAGHDRTVDVRNPYFWSRGIQLSASERPARDRFPHHPGASESSRWQSRDDGCVGRCPDGA